MLYEIKVDNQNYDTYIDELKNHQFYELSHRFIINCVTALYFRAQFEDETDNNIDNNYNECGSNDSTLLEGKIE